jgi:polysaccharide biosynthesis/export protein
MFALSRRLLVLLLIVLLPAGVAAQSTAPDSGDFHVGDRILLTVSGEPQLTDAFTVVPGPALDLPVIGTVSLAGVRYVNLQSYLSQTIGRYVRDATVRASATMRIGMLGQVQHPGFYSVPTDALVTDAFMAAGGPTNDARLNSAKIVREGHAAVSSDSLARAMASGLTLAQLGVRSGDAIDVPAQRNTQMMVQIIALAVTVPAAIIALLRAL